MKAIWLLLYASKYEGGSAAKSGNTGVIAGWSTGCYLHGSKEKDVVAIRG